METSVTLPETQSLLHQPGGSSNNWSRQDKKIALFIATTGIFCLFASAVSFIEKSYFFNSDYNCVPMNDGCIIVTVSEFSNCSNMMRNNSLKDIWHKAIFVSAISGIASTGAALMTFILSKK